MRRIVADGELTLANMREAAARTMECFELVGSDFFIEELGYGDFSVTIKFELGQGLDEVLEEMGEEVYRASINCELEYWNELWSLWELIRLNPEAEDFDGMIAECLIRNDLAAEGFTGRQFREASMSCGLLIEDDPMNPLSPEERQELFEAHWEATRDCRPQLPGPVYLDEGVAWDCQMDPLNN
ncbi:MAG: hypothetical protein FWD83_07540 [Promicromonosporaceae bacterium]|nr:hypothetical protein [Promicromonosporaceae bacterium]